MISKIQQLCKSIAKHPSKVNLVNQALATALGSPNHQDLKAILELIEKMTTSGSQGIIDFWVNKVRAIFMVLLALAVEEADDETMFLLQKCYELSTEKEPLVAQFLTLAGNNSIEWTAAWPANLLIGVFEQLNSTIEAKQSKEADWQLVIAMILTLPDFAELEINAELEPSFKKRKTDVIQDFQKLVLSVLACESIPIESLKQLYHGLGMKVLSKMGQPLALANHCLQRFAQNAEIQIEVLSCLFLLVGKYGLELEQFYPKLQKLITFRKHAYSIYELPNSRRFFKLLEAALRSSRVPFKTVSKFAHILIRQLPGESGQFTFWAISFVINLTKKHRKLVDELPLLPEIKALRHHYNSKVRSLVNQLSKNLNKIDYLEIEDFTKVNLKAMTEKKLSQAIGSLEDKELEFKIPIFQEALTL